jgi:hypothetical protein
MTILEEVVMALSFWIGIIIAYTIDWYIEVWYPWPFKRNKNATL